MSCEAIMQLHVNLISSVGYIRICTSSGGAIESRVVQAVTCTFHWIDVFRTGCIGKMRLEVDNISRTLTSSQYPNFSISRRRKHPILDRGVSRNREGWGQRGAKRYTTPNSKFPGSPMSSKQPRSAMAHFRNGKGRCSRSIAILRHCVSTSSSPLRPRSVTRRDRRRTSLSLHRRVSQQPSTGMPCSMKLFGHVKITWITAGCFLERRGYRMRSRQLIG